MDRAEEAPPPGRLRRSRALIAALAVPAAMAAALSGAVAADRAPPPTDFNGVWKLDRSLEPLAHPVRPGPAGLPRGWKALGGFAGHANTPPPLRPEIHEQVAKDEARALAGEAVDQRAVACKPAAIFDQLTRGSRVDLVQRWNEVVMLIEGARTLPRHIYIGHQHPPADELTPSIIGHSTAQWEGKTLVVDTVGIQPNTYLLSPDFIPQSDQTHLVERLRLQAPGVLTDTVEVTDPKVLTRPWTIHLVYRKQPVGVLLSEAVCTTAKWDSLDRDP
jgi:hypothetical protein